MPFQGEKCVARPLLFGAMPAERFLRAGVVIDVEEPFPVEGKEERCVGVSC